MAKKITLRKSAAIQKELFARANNLHIETSVEINEFVRPNEIIETGLREGFQAALLSEQRHLVSLRSTETTRARLEAFFAKQS